MFNVFLRPDSWQQVRQKLRLGTKMIGFGKIRKISDFTTRFQELRVLRIARFRCWHSNSIQAPGQLLNPEVIRVKLKVILTIL